MEQHPDTRAVHAAEIHDANASAISSPIYLSTTFRRDSDGSIGEYLYSRYSNPNRDAFEKALAEMEGGTHAYAFSSGLAATMSILQCLSTGDHVVIPDDAYYGLRSQLTDIFSRFGIGFTVADCTNESAVIAALRPETKFLWIETPSNPLVKITDIGRMVSIAHERNVLVICDNTWATPVLQQPLAAACDVVMHSATKYIGGHSDILCGVVVVRDHAELSQQLKRIQMVGGAVPSPFECWLACRGLQTLPLRVRTASESAQRIAEYFNEHPLVESVFYPSLPSHPGFSIAASQMSMNGAMLSLCIRGTREQALKVASATRVFAHATSLGAVESLIEHRASVEPADSQTPGNLLRLSVGLEACDDLIDDLEAALEAVLGTDG